MFLSSNPLLNKDKPLWLSKRDKDSNLEIDFYKKPVFYKVNYQPVSGAINFIAYGQEINKMFRAIVPMGKFYGVFEEGDKVYIDGVEFDESKENEDTWGEYANYVVDSVRNQNIAIEIIFKRNDKEGL